MWRGMTSRVRGGGAYSACRVRDIPVTRTCVHVYTQTALPSLLTPIRFEIRCNNRHFCNNYSITFGFWIDPKTYELKI